ncbi:DUF6284 family protein [Promicromonospora sukumoe]|uniref:Uncharacterized protein n=1 Tax=Promicromonospora sukumoe TaxID=88382 RepID=A0A7W3JD43_9MICO|nr:DUF6284 family protein [Promicromonospora sukumoe]MBA8810647.1 hypothetical protein [Promicromonospora sukumoe]
MTYTDYAGFEVEPTFTDLAAIAAEEPVISAEVAVVDAECQMAASPGPAATEAHRRAVTALNTVIRTRASRATSTAPVFGLVQPLSTARRVVIRPAHRTAA